MESPTLIIVAVVAVLVVAVLVGWLLTRRRQSPVVAVEGGRSRRLRKTADSLGAALRRAWSDGIESSTWEGMEDALLAADVGVDTAADVVAAVRRKAPSDADSAKAALADTIREQLEGRERSLNLEGAPAVVLVVGVNGTGKTTTIAKLASLLQAGGSSVVLAAADTFRAAAGEQLSTWASRIDVPIVTGQEGGDPASVVFDAIAAARSRNADVVLVDTAGRLHSKKNLMAELSKIHRVAGDGGPVAEALIVLDGTSGQNGLTQVSEFASAVPLTGVVLTKLDGTAKGGIVLAVERKLGIPVKLVGLGEGIDDLEVFDPDRFVTELLESA
jgi:fused signal recognition particle receptor